eukprot:7376375-Prymnesium_polylepis.1
MAVRWRVGSPHVSVLLQSRLKRYILTGDCEGRRVARSHPPPVPVGKRYSGPGTIPQSGATRDIERLVLVDHFCLNWGGATLRPCDLHLMPSRGILQSDAPRDIERLVLVDQFCLKGGGRPCDHATFTSCHPGGILQSDAPRDITSKALALAPHAHAHHVCLAILHVYDASVTLRKPRHAHALMRELRVRQA